MSIQRLIAVLTPPSIPLEVPELNGWSAVEQTLGSLPTDYKEFVERFGSGTIDDFLWIMNPFSANKHGNLLSAKEGALNALRELRAGGEPCPYRLYPEPEGLLPFGQTDNGDVLFWSRQGRPDDWAVVVNASREPEYEEFHFNLTDFLAYVLSREVRCSIFPEAFPSDHPKFKPKS